jgi:hypothetical protein
MTGFVGLFREIARRPGVLRDMARRPWYYANSVWTRTYRRLSRRGLFDNTVFAKTAPSLEHYDSIVVVLNSRMMHVGDQLFFLPLIYKLADRGYPVSVKVGRNLAFLFSKQMLAPPRGRRTLYVSRLPVLPAIWRMAGQRIDFLVYEMLLASRIPEPIGLFFVRTFCSHFRLTDISPTMTPAEMAAFAHPMVLPDELKPLIGKPLVFLSNYIDSGQHMLHPATTERLFDDITRYKKEHGGTVVHLGTAKDRESDPADYSALVDVDLRGRTSVADLFAMFANLHVAKVFTFDNAVLHIARMYDLPVEVYWRTETVEGFLDCRRIFTHFFDAGPFERESTTSRPS